MYLQGTLLLAKIFSNSAIVNRSTNSVATEYEPQIEQNVIESLSFLADSKYSCSLPHNLHVPYVNTGSLNKISLSWSTNTGMIGGAAQNRFVEMISVKRSIELHAGQLGFRIGIDSVD